MDQDLVALGHTLGGEQPAPSRVMAASNSAYVQRFSSNLFGSQIRNGWSGCCSAQWETSQEMSWPAIWKASTLGSSPVPSPSVRELRSGEIRSAPGIAEATGHHPGRRPC